MSTDEQACLRTLSFTEMHARESNIEPAVNDTGNWLLESVDYQDWARRERLDQHHGFFWIKGNPGSGKSTLIKKIFADMKANSSDPSSIITAFFFNARGSDVERSPTGLFRTLLHSLCQQISALRATVLSKYLEKSRLLLPGWQWHPNEVKALLKSVVMPSILGQRRLILFVDALDECDFAEVKSLIRFFEDLASSAIEQDTRINICLSSRYWPQFEIRYCFQTRVEIANQRDIEIYIHNAMGPPDPQTNDSAHLIPLKTQILKKASGIFLWVVLVVQGLLDARHVGATPSELENIVRKVPSDLSGLYLHQLQSTNIEDRRPLLRLLQCIFYSQRPLSATELRYALAFSTETFASYAEWSQSGDYVENDAQMEKRICEISRGLVEIKSSPNSDRYALRTGARGMAKMTVQFIHESVRDFLQASGFTILVQPSCPNHTGDGHNLIKGICLNYLKVGELAMVQSVVDPLTNREIRRQMPTVLEDHPLLEYMVDYLFKHAAYAEQHGIPQDDLRTLMGSNVHGYFQRWRILNDLVHSIRDDRHRRFSTYGTHHTELEQQGAEVKPLHIFSQHGLLTQDVVDKENNINILGGFYQHAMLAAAANGKVDTVKLLLANGAELDVADSLGYTAFHWAAFREDLPILSLLKDKLSLMRLEKRLQIADLVYLETPHFHEILALLVPETTISHLALSSVCRVASYTCVRAFSFVLDKLDGSIVHDERLLRACRRGFDDLATAKKLMALLQKLEPVKITPSFLDALDLDGLVYVDSVVSMLFEKGDFEVDEMMMNSICRLKFSSKLISQLKAAKLDVPPITSQHILSVLQHGSVESVAFFIPHTDNSLQSEALFLAAVTNEHNGVGVMRLLLGRRPTYRIGDDVMMAAVQNHSGFPDLLKIFIDLWEDLVIPAAALSIAVKQYDANTIRLIYDRCNLPAITEDLLISPICENSYRDGVVEFILERNPSLTVSQRVVYWAVIDLSLRVVTLVMERCRCLVMTEDLLVNAARNDGHAAGILDLLLESEPTHVVSESLMVAAVDNRVSGGRIMNIFLRHGKPLLLSEKVVEVAARRDSWEAFDMIFRSNKGAAISSTMTMKVMQRSSGDDMISAILRHDPSISMTEDYLIAAATNEYGGSKILAFLEKNGKIHKPTLPTEYNETRAAKRGRLSRKRSSSHRSRVITPQITEKVIKAAATNERPGEARRILALFQAWGFLGEADRRRYYETIEERQRFREMSANYGYITELVWYNRRILG